MDQFAVGQGRLAFEVNEYARGVIDVFTEAEISLSQVVTRSLASTVGLFATS